MPFPALPPRGFQDAPPDECAARWRLYGALGACFAGHGYRQVETPLLERYALFAQGPARLPEASLWKTTAPDGSILVLRPDNTTPTVRLACARMQDEALPIRLFYLQSRVAYPGSLRYAASSLESHEAGVELLGESGPRHDAEALALAVRALQQTGLPSFQMDLGHVGFFLGLLEEAGLSPEDAETLRAAVEGKNQLEVDLLLDKPGADGLPDGRASVRETLRRLPQLYGGREVLDEAARMTRSGKCRAALDGLAAVWDLMEAEGLGDLLSVDLGMVQSIHYYTGIVFRGITRGIPRPVLSGGRYDALPASLGRGTGAVGFAVKLEPVIDALFRKDDAAHDA